MDYLKSQTDGESRTEEKFKILSKNKNSVIL